MKVALALGFATLALAASAQAHFSIIAPPPASTITDGGKGAPPCGPVQDSNVITPVQGGHPLPLQVAETVFHPGFYRVALALNSPSELPADNVVKNKAGDVLTPDGNGLSETAQYELAPVFPVLADGLWLHDMPHEAPFQTQLTLPNVTCEKCTLQVIEFMSNHEPNPGGGFFYHHCANLKITADPALPAFDPTANSGGAPAMAFSNGSLPDGGAGGSAASGGNASGGSASGGNVADVGASGGNGGASGSSDEPPGGASFGGSFGSVPIAGTTAASGSSAVAPSGSKTSDSSGCALSQRTTPSSMSLAWCSLVLIGAWRRRNAR